jgi:hypothetical protein
MAIGILQCGAPPEALIKDHGTFGDMMRRMLGPDWTTKTFDVTRGELPGNAAECEAYVLSCPSFQDAGNVFHWLASKR